MAHDTILAATDLSARADRAIDRALQLGARRGLPVTVLHVVEEGENAGGEPGRVEEAVRAVLPDPAADVTILIAEGSPAQTIADITNERQDAFVVVGVSRFNSLGDYVMGTSADNLIRRSNVPVLVAKHRPHAPYGRILCGVDCSQPAAHALATALRLFPDQEIAAVHAYHVGFEGWQRDEYVYKETLATAEKKLAEFVAALPVSEADRKRVRASVRYGDVGEVLAEEIEREKPDLLVLGTQGAGGFKHAALGSTAASLLAWVEPDTLVVPPL
jgi:nucleotide-binding universal stress UspA family protein